MKLLITGDTYLLRRELRGMGCVYSYNDNGWIGEDTEELKGFCQDRGLEYTTMETELVLDEKFVVDQKNIKAQRRAERHRVRATKLEAKAESTDISQHEKDFLSLGEPIKVGHHSEKRHRKLIDKARNTLGKRVELYDKANEAEGKAEYWEGKKYYTEEEKQARKDLTKRIRTKAEAIRKGMHKVGDVYDGWHTMGIIKKINSKTVTLEGGSRWEITYAKDFETCLQLAQGAIEISDSIKQEGK